jgi:hypothetical protein
MLVLVCVQAIGGPIMGLIAETFGSRAAVVVSGGVPFLAAVVISIVLARSGQLRLRVTPRLRGSWITIAPRAAGADLE